MRLNGSPLFRRSLRCITPGRLTSSWNSRNYEITNRGLVSTSRDGSLRKPSRDRKSFISKIASLHNSGEIDLFVEFQKLRNNQQGSGFYLTRRIFEEALPKLEGASIVAAQCTVHLITEAGQDLMACTPISAFRLFLDAAPTRPAERSEEHTSEL